MEIGIERILLTCPSTCSANAQGTFLIWDSSLNISFSCLTFRFSSALRTPCRSSCLLIYIPAAPPLGFIRVEFCLVSYFMCTAARSSVVQLSGQGVKEKKRAMALEGEEAIVQLDAEELFKMQDLWAKLPEEVQQKIFKHLRWRQLFRICVVCKSFNDGINRYVHELPLFRTAVPFSNR